ncbi:uncharacterized protein LAESUDRAFT_666231 [Laetiporus sulphureus 93-53]|uniref:Uncharacterized protein n=1 Tax=Laetiporus sulphureus 93-53 TaxID=1314785 RepID=A0A165B6W7_9APHY|nr:uncharacterized protein LAESUDRAFT_666231 [Laetiporus sulphureus 93-53]KZT00381.1 hypothetical protein LAESUDRAFT_666231 [Laetiporus sulphureus 93-53]
MAPIGLTAGVIEIGILISTFLYGITTMQAYIYARSYGRDPWWLQTLVLFGMLKIYRLLETLLTVLTCIYLYSLTITNFGKLATLQDLPWSMDVSFAIGGLLSAIVQSFFAWRVYIISGRLLTSLVSWSASFCRVVITVTICVLDVKSKTVGRYESLYPWTITFSLALAMFIDVLNTCALCFWLWKKQDHRHSSSAMIDKIMTWTIGKANDRA